jgi:hypothetical protein
MSLPSGVDERLAELHPLGPQPAPTCPPASAITAAIVDTITTERT